MLFFYFEEEIKNVVSINDGPESICHYGISSNIPNFENKTWWQSKNFDKWKKPYDDFFMHKTKNLLNFYKHILPYNDFNIEIWYPKNQNSVELYILHKKLAKLIQSVKKCDDEPNYIFQTDLFCMLRNFLTVKLNKNNNNNNSAVFEPHNLDGILFFLAELYDKRVKIQLVIEMDNLNNLTKFTLVIARVFRYYDFPDDLVLRKKYNNWYRREITRSGIDDEKYNKDDEINKIINEIDPKNYKCDLVYAFSDDSQKIKKYGFIHEMKYITDNKTSFQNSKVVYITEEYISNFVKKYYNSSATKEHQYILKFLICSFLISLF